MTVSDIIKQKKLGNKITVLTAYEYNFARIMQNCNIDIILIGDSLGTAFQGKSSTKTVTMENIIYHLQIVRTAAKNTFIVADMPYKSDLDPEKAVLNAKSLIEAGADAVKLEGNKSEIISAILKENIPVMGHLGLLPQTAEEFRVQGKDNDSYNRILQDAKDLDKAGVFSVVLECIPEKLAEEITSSISIPTIGIGAGIHCDGQVIVITDLLGMSDSKLPKFVKKYADLDSIVNKAVKSYINDVKSLKYPDSEHTYH